jgi:rhodanese-related sulfurtransferase
MAAIRPEELDERLDEDVFVLDVRPREAFQEDHLEGSRNVPVYGDLQQGDPEALERVASTTPGGDVEVVTVCKMGIVATRATDHLREQGEDARTLAGGMSAWRGYRAGSLSYRLRSLLWDLRAALPG